MEHIETMKRMLGELLRVTNMEMEKGIDKANSDEMGKAIDMIYDLSHSMYFMSVVNAMEHSNGASFDPNTEPERMTMKMYE